MSATAEGANAAVDQLRFQPGSPLSSAEQFDNLARLRMSTKLRFLEDRRIIAQHLESSAARGNQLHLLVRK
jgi:hypothetical protein